MAANFLEQLLTEWYEHQGYFVRRNVSIGKRKKGGYECELGIVALNPAKRHLVHIEPSMDAESWAKREKRFRNKFEAGRKYVPGLFEGFQVPSEIEQVAVLVHASKVNHKTLGGGRLVLISELLEEIFRYLKTQELAKTAIPEHLPLLRGLQFVSQYHKVIERVWSDYDAYQRTLWDGDANR